MLYVNIKKCRKIKNMTQEELSNEIELSQSYISGLESSPQKKNPTLKIINKMAKALNICPLDILSCDCEKCNGSK